jgi:hypothetical protein
MPRSALSISSRRIFPKRQSDFDSTYSVNLSYFIFVPYLNQMTDPSESMLFRQKLYDNFKESGLLSKLKTSLRADLLQKL